MKDATSNEEAMIQMVEGFRISQSISVAVRVGVPDALGDSTKSAAELATTLACHPDALYRLLRALATVDVLVEEDGQRFHLTELGGLLRSDHPASMAGWAAFVGHESQWRAWGDLLWSVRTGGNAFRHVFGTDSWTYRTEHPEAAAIFDAAMTSLSLITVESLLDAFDFGRFAVIADIGGGAGAFLADILRRYPDAKGILFDLPHSVAGSGPILAEIADRCEVVAGSFFESIPAGADAYIMKSILHDWEDDDCVRILTSCRKAMKPNAALLLVERALGPANTAWWAKVSDLNMLVGPGGRERTAGEYARLMAQAGIEWVGETPTASGRSVFEGRA